MGLLDDALSKGMKALFNPYIQNKAETSIPKKFEKLRAKGAQKQQETGEKHFVVKEQRDKKIDPHDPIDTYEGNIYDNPTEDRQTWIHTNISGKDGTILEDFNNYKDKDGNDILNYKALMAGKSGAHGDSSTTFINGVMQKGFEFNYK